MTVKMANYEETFIQELRDLPKEYLPNLLQIVHLFKESVTLAPAKDSFRQGWKEVREGKTYPVSELWEEINAE